MGNRPSRTQNLNYRNENQHRHPPRQRVPREANRPIVEFPEDDEDENTVSKEPIQKDYNPLIPEQNRKHSKGNEYFSYGSKEEDHFRREKPSTRPIHHQNGPLYSQPIQHERRYGGNTENIKQTAENPKDKKSGYVDPKAFTRTYYENDIPGYGKIGHSSNKSYSQRSFLKRSTEERNSRQKPTEKPSRYVLVRKDFDESLLRNLKGTQIKQSNNNPADFNSTGANRSKIKSENCNPVIINSTNTNPEVVKSNIADKQNLRSDATHPKERRYSTEASHTRLTDEKTNTEPLDKRGKTLDSNKQDTQLNPNDTTEDLNPWINSHLWEI